MKQIKLFLALAVAVLLGACGNKAENVADATTYEVKGSVKNMQDGTILMLFSYNDGGGSMIAMDTVQAGSFYFKVSPETDNTERYMIAGVRNPDVSPLGLHFWAAAGDCVRITGDNNLIFTWEVNAPAPENTVLGKYIKRSRDLWNRRQEILIERNQLSHKVKHDQLASQAQRLSEEEDSLMILTAANDLRIMHKSKIDAIWLEMFCNNAIISSKLKDFPYTEELRQLYEGLTAEQRNHRFAKEACTALFTRQHVAKGKAIDGELWDLDGNKHSLAELQGTFVLLDFWGKGCAPCMKALPELAILAEMYNDKLSIVSISTDTDDVWREASKQHPMTWYNWCDGNGSDSMFARYGKGSIPLFVLISPEGYILDTWRGYGQGSLTNRLKGIIE
ncbi:MAG: AhpC/TSA family protein [Bacteroidaceae bacterium]|nr:AhpC/TSA family protein [Bacteroidaceae bacterium]